MNLIHNTLYELAIVFAPLSLVTIGGGQATIPEIQHQVVDIHHWMTSIQFMDAFAIGKLAPGPGSLMVSLIGWHVAGLLGVVTVVLSMFLPTAFLILGMAYLWKRHSGARWQRAMEVGLRPIAAGMILATVYVLLKSLTGGWVAWVIFLLSTIFVMCTKISPMIVVLGSAVIMVVFIWL